MSARQKELAQGTAACASCLSGRFARAASKHCHTKRRRHAKNVPPRILNLRAAPKLSAYLPRFAYQSALTGVKLAHLSGKSSSAKMAVTGQTGTQAPQSMHSVG